ncbi:MAG: class I SAM-dependent methyltransferase [Cypionkella sp.]
MDEKEAALPGPKPGADAAKGMFKRTVEKVAQLATTQVKEGDGFVQHIYDDYETYRLVQEEGNKGKLRAQFVKKGHIFFLAQWMKDARATAGAEGAVAGATAGATAGAAMIEFGLCHGVRRGKEQAWFSRKLDGANVIGTDISETAREFPNTVQWDFHDDNPEWAGKADFVYSNSWDHAYDPGKAFRAWAKCLKQGGWILIDHTRGHMPNSSNVLDPFGATRDAVIRILNDACVDLGRVTEVLDRTAEKDYPATVIVFTRS